MTEAIHQPPEQPPAANKQTDESPADAGRRQQVLTQAAALYQRGPDWVTFFREVLGVGGIVRRIFSRQEEVDAFEQSEEFIKIQQMVAKLRDRSKHPAESDEPTRVITVRLPKSLHESLRKEAHEKHTSMNQLCISKLLQIIDSELVPSD